MKINKEKFNLIRARKCLAISTLRAAGVTDGNLNSIWAQKSMRPETVGKVAKALGVDVTEILEDEA